MQAPDRTRKDVVVAAHRDLLLRWFAAQLASRGTRRRAQLRLGGELDVPPGDRVGNAMRFGSQHSGKQKRNTLDFSWLNLEAANVDDLLRSADTLM